jgi:SAM-dependent methyltransferase
MLSELNRRIKRTSLYQRYKHSRPYVLQKEFIKSVRRRASLPRHLGTEFGCPVCGTQLRSFRPGSSRYPKMMQDYGYVYPLDAIETFNIAAYSCYACDASDRERLYALYLDDVFTAIDRSRRYRLLEFAPSPGLLKRLRSQPFIDYRSADLFRTLVDDRVDIQDMRGYTDGSFDIVLCSHVLEHVPDDRRAMRELHRVLHPRGFAIVMVPLIHGVDETHEDPAIDTDALKWKYYGDGDHARQYGKADFARRLAEAGFALETLGVAHFGAERFRRAGIADDSVLYVVRHRDGPVAA